MSVLHHKQYPASVKIGYCLLILACAAVSVKIVLQMIAEGQSTASSSSETFESPVGVDINEEPPAATVSALVADPEVDQRIQQILNQENESDDGVTPSLNDTLQEPTVTAVDSAIVATTVRQDRATSKPVSQPVRQKAPLHEQMVTPGNFEYAGAFRPPLVHDMESKFSYGGWALAFREGGDPDGQDDGYPGSLFFVGHRLEELVAEISIPVPVVSERKSLDDLNVCGVLQPFADITGGIQKQMTNGSSEPFQIGGLQVLNDRLYWTLYKYYNVGGHDFLSHGVSTLDLRRPRVGGPWHLGPMHTSEPQWHSYKNAGYVFDIPQPVADRYFGGKNLMSGLQISTGLQKSSQGPALYAYEVPQRAPAPGSSIDAIPCLWYPMSRPIPGHHYADKWTGAAWLTVGGKQSVVIVGRKAHGEVYYGLPRPGDCYEDKGYHGSSYEAQMLFYAPGDLLEGAKASVPTLQPWYRWDSKTPGGGLNRFMFQDCGKEIGGVAYDRRNNLLYVAEVSAGFAKENEWERLPIVHVFRLRDK